MKTSCAVLASLLAAAALTAGATEWYYVGASNDWWNAASYSTTKSKSGNTVMPSGTDRIHPASASSKLYMDDTTVAFLNTVGGINFDVNGATLYVNLTTNATVTGCIGDIGGHGYYDNWLVKDGAGVLSFDGTSGKSPYYGISGSGTSRNSYRYTMSYDVRAGGLRLEPKRSYVYRSYFGGVRVAAGATFYCVNGTDQQVYFGRGLAGAGTFTTENTGNAYEVRVSDAAGQPPKEFSGVLSGKMDLYFGNPTILSGTSNTGVSTIRAYGYVDGSETKGILSVKTFAGSLGGKTISTQTGAACIRMINEADETVKSNFAIQYSPLALDAGARGGVTFSPSNWWGLENYANVQQLLILTGSNTTANVFSGPCRNNGGTSGYPSFFVTKRGTGTWRFDCERTDQGSDWVGGLRGVFAVDEGTLETVSLAERGNRCSLGYADWLFEDKSAATNTLAKVPYAIRLGTPKTGEGTLSYVGTAAKSIATRPIGVQGKGRLKAPNAPYLNWTGISGLASGSDNAITFECAAGQTNTVRDLSGNLSVVKEGAGGLELKGDLTFAGNLDIRQGTATVWNPNGAPYSWFKVTVKETVNSSTNSIYSKFTIKESTDWYGRTYRSYALGEFGLYDASGKRINAYQKDWAGTETTAWKFEFLKPGQIAPYPTGGVQVWADTYTGYAWLAADNKTVTGSKYRLARYHWTTATLYPQFEKPATWLSLVQRLKDADIGKAASLDLNFLSYSDSAPTAIEVFGSADGLAWDSLFATNNIEVTAQKYMWLSNGANTGGNVPDSISHPKFPLPRTTAAQTTEIDAANWTVSVAREAGLAVAGTPVAVSKLRVARSGMGSTSGVKLAAAGEIDVDCTLAAGEHAVLIPVDFTQFGSDWENVKGWTLRLNGQTPTRDVTISANGITVRRRGMAVLLK